MSDNGLLKDVKISKVDDLRTIFFLNCFFAWIFYTTFTEKNLKNKRGDVYSGPKSNK